MEVILPEGLKELLAPRLKSNATGFQRSHVTGRVLWVDSEYARDAREVA